MTCATQPVNSAHHMMKFIDLQLRVEGKSMVWLSKQSGVSYTCIKRSMNSKRSMNIRSVEALLNTLGYTMKPTPIAAARGRA